MLWNCKENHRICFQNPKKCYNGGLLEKVCFHPGCSMDGFCYNEAMGILIEFLFNVHGILNLAIDHYNLIMVI